MNNTARKTGASMERAIRKPQVAKRPFSRIEGEPFDANKVSTRLSAVVARNVLDEKARIDRKMGRA